MSSQFVQSRSRQGSIVRGRAGSGSVGMPSREEIEQMEMVARLNAQTPTIVPELVIPGKPVSRLGKIRNGIVKGAKYVGSGIANGAMYAGSGIAKGAKYVGNGVASLAGMAGGAVVGGVKMVGNAIGFAKNDYDRDFARDKLKGLGNTIVSKAALGFGLAAKGVAATVLFGTAVAAATVIGVAAAGVSIAAGGVAAIRGGYRWNKASNMIKALKGIDVPEAHYAIGQLEKRVQRSKSQVVAGALGVVGGAITLAAGAATGGIVAGAIVGVAGAALGIHALGETIAGQTDALKPGEKGGGLRESKYMVKLFGARKKDGTGIERNKQAEAIVAGLEGFGDSFSRDPYVALVKALELNINPDHLADPAKRKSAVTLVANALKST